MKGLFIPDITAEMFKNGCLESIEALMTEGEIYDIDYSPWIPVRTRTMTKEEVKEFNESEFDYPMDEDKENWTYDCCVPDEPCQVLITTAWDEVRCVEFGRDGSFVWFEGFEDRDDVKAWMPLPEPYKAESEDKE